MATAVAGRGGHVSYECDHARSIPYAIPGFEKMVELKITTEEQKARVMKLLKDADDSSSVIVLICSV